MINREYIKSQIDALPEKTVIDIAKYIARQAKSRRNIEYLDMLGQSRKEIEEGDYITIPKEQLETWLNE